MDIETSMRQILEAEEQQRVRNIPYSPTDRAVELILEHVHRRRESSSPQAWVKPGRLP